MDGVLQGAAPGGGAVAGVVNRMRALLCAPLAALLLVAVACGSSEGPGPEPTAPPPPLVVTVVVTPTPAPEPTPEPTSPPAAQPAVRLDLGPGLGQHSVAELVRAATPWVASITTEEDVPGFFNNFDSDGAGSGFVIRPDGYVVTNWHVVEGADNVKVHLPNGRSYAAEMVGRDAGTDLAVLKIDAIGLPAAKMADEQPSVGDWVMAVGNALALKGGPTVTLGIVSGLDRSIQTARGVFYDLIQTDAAVNVGNSGGPLVNMNGEVVGVNQATLRQAEGISFAINTSVATPIIDILIQDGFVVRPTIGLNGRDLTPAIAARYRIEATGEGMIITSVARGGPAFRSGMLVGDVITKIDAIPTPDRAAYQELLWSYDVGDSVSIEYIRDNQVRTTVVELAQQQS